MSKIVAYFFQTSSFCGENPEMTLTPVADLQVVCGEFSIEEAPEQLTPEEEVVMEVSSFTNHPLYDPAKGPIGGYDLAIFKVKDSPLRQYGAMSRRGIWPACFPKKSYMEAPSILAGWKDPRPSFLSYADDEEIARVYSLRNLQQRQTRMKLKAKCQDPKWMNIKEGSFYPAGTICAKDPSSSSCLVFGNSGSPLMRPYTGHPGRGPYWYSWTGSLSMYYGCDQALSINTGDSDVVAHAGDNPGVFTQASCYLQWIADQYNMKLGPRLQEVAGECARSTGTLNVTKQQCRTNRNLNCDFTASHAITVPTLGTVSIKMDKCKIFDIEG